MDSPAQPAGVAAAAPPPPASPKPPPAPTRRSDRPRQRPRHLDDIYDTPVLPGQRPSHPDSSTASAAKYPISDFLSYDGVHPSYYAFLAAVTSNHEPRSFRQAVLDPRWREAMSKEIYALELNGTWTLVQLPPGKRAIAPKWVYKIKFNPDGTIERYKARLVAKGYTQIEGVDFHDTFAPVAKLVTVRCLLAVAVSRGWFLHQLDVNNAFLHGDLEEEVYMQIPQGFAQPGETRVCRLNKSLYGLRQASRNWYHKFTDALCSLGFRASPADHSLFIFRRGSTFVVALIYVDDVLLTGNDLAFINKVKSSLDVQFGIKDLGEVRYFLGMEFARTTDGVALCQRKYALDILADAGVSGARPSAFPVEQNHHLTRPTVSGDVLADPSAYRRLVGRLLYLTVTSPDLTYGVNILSQFVSAPRQDHMDAAVRLLRYLKSTPAQGLFYPASNDLTLTAYCDADWGGCESTRRSSTGYFISLGGAPISWRTKKQRVVARSSAEAEYRAMASTVSEIVWLRWLLSELGAPQTRATPLYCDNQAALHIAANPVFHERTKHVEMDCYFIRERVQSGDVLPLKVSSHLQLADIFTKGLGADRFRFLLSKLNVRNLHAPACGGVLDKAHSRSSAHPHHVTSAAHALHASDVPSTETLVAYCKQGYICLCTDRLKPEH
ncbi:unnamed protein product [Linum trigynum]|uniref:Reverse transcriptase Ty1/copia-type domain-containing protein n=1 Tax=Linum trigynum TaxID=586398 RepID=A0AAV2DFU4_9ROSI